MLHIKPLSFTSLFVFLFLAVALNLIPLTPIPAFAQEDTPVLRDWQYYDNTLGPDEASACFTTSSPDRFVIGWDTSCQTGPLGGMATAVLDVPAADANRVLVIRIVCVGVTGCKGAISAQAAGSVTLSIDGQILWGVQCTAASTCNTLALSDSPQIVYVASPSSQHILALVASPYVSLAIERIDVSWQETPSLIRGLGYSPFRDCQTPHFGITPTAADIHEDMMVVRNMANAIRTYSSTGVQGLIPNIARQYGLRVSAGAALGPEHDAEGKAKNEAEIASVIALSRTLELESIIVGNEVLLRHDLTEEQLIEYIDRVQAAVDVPVTTAATSGEYFDHPALIDHVDYVLVHIYAFWQGQPIDRAARFVAAQYGELEARAKGKHVVIGETGWPSGGPAFGAVVPSPENQRRFLHEFLAVADEEEIEFYYFSGFNELWKTAEGGVGQFWGILDSQRRSQYDIQSVLIPVSMTAAPTVTANTTTANQSSPPASTTQIAALPVPTVTAEPSGTIQNQSPTFSVYSNYALILEGENAFSNHFAPSGYMGDWHAMHVDTCAQHSEAWEDRVIKIQYTPNDEDPGGWAGVYWQQPENNWASIPEGGFNLEGYTQVRFRARADVEGAQVKFIVGGTKDGPYPSSLRSPVFAQEANSEGFVTLSTSWQEYHIDLQGQDLNSVIDGFGWIGDREYTPEGVTVYIDDIVYDQAPPPLAAQLPIYNARSLAPGFDMNVDTSRHVYDWVMDEGGFMRLDYPSGQQWGVVFLTVGPAAPLGQRQSMDFSSYDALVVDLRGEVGGEVVSIGIKTVGDPDDGREVKIPVTLTTEWQPYVFDLSRFGLTKEELKKLYVPIEFVFEPNTRASTVYFRNIVYLAHYPYPGFRGPASVAETCTLSAISSANVRAAPNTGANIVEILPQSRSIAVIAQFIGPDQRIWWKIGDRRWVRFDVVTTSGDCSILPFVES